MTSNSTQPLYTHGHHATVLRSHSWRTLENSCAYLIPHLDTLVSSHTGSTPLKILDLGCGPGTITVDFAVHILSLMHPRPGPAGLNFKVVGLEHPSTSESVLEGGKRLAEEKGVNEYVEWTKGDAMGRLPFEDGEFDIVHAHQVLQHVEDPVRVLTEMKRVARKSETGKAGIVAFRDSDYSSFAWYPTEGEAGRKEWNEGLKKWLDLYRKIAKSNGGEPDAGKMLHSWARKAGLWKPAPVSGASEISDPTNILISSSTWTFATPSTRQFWGSMWADRITSPGSQIVKTALEKGFVKDKEELEEIGRCWRKWIEDDEGWFLVVCGEMICWV